MSNAQQVAAQLNTHRIKQGRSVLWLHRETGIPYKGLLEQIKGRRPITLETTCETARALGIDFRELATS